VKNAFRRYVYTVSREIWTLLQVVIPEVFVIKNVPINMGSIPNGYCAMGFFFELSKAHSFEPSVLHVTVNTFVPTNESGRRIKFQAYVRHVNAILGTGLWQAVRNARYSQLRFQVPDQGGIFENIL
jgi:hypothetical protein